MVQRVTLPTRLSYNTASNRCRQVKTPGGRRVMHRVHKAGTRRKCAETGVYLNGLPRARSAELARFPKNKKTVSRPYGGHYSHQVVRDRILRAFLFEEKRCVRAVQLEKLRQKKTEEEKKSSKKGNKRTN